MKHGIWLVGLSNSQVLHLLIGQWSDKPVNIGTVEVTVYDHLPGRELILLSYFQSFAVFIVFLLGTTIFNRNYIAY